MGDHDEAQGGYAVPTYRADSGTTWYHFLHGNVPGHQIDFMYRPEVPQGPLARQHFSHLSRLMKYIEPQTNSAYAFAIGNLSRDDTQYEPGHGGLGIIFGFRIRGVTDHAGRQDPPFAHGIAAIDRRLDYSAVLSSSLSFYQHLFGKGEYDNPSSVLYREYVKFALQKPSVISYVLKAYTADFEDLPSPDPSALSLRWLTNGATQPKRIVIVHPDKASFGDIAECAAKIAAVLYQSDVRWTAITTGRESDMPGGVTIRLVAKRDASAYESGGPMVSIDEVPDDEAELAEKLFGAQRVGGVPEATGPVGGWRERYRSQSGHTSTPPPPDSGQRGASARGGAGTPSFDFEVAGSEGPGASKREDAGRLWEGRAGGSGGDGAQAEPPKAWGQSARLSPNEIRAAIGLPPLPGPSSAAANASNSAEMSRANAKAPAAPPAPSVDELLASVAGGPLAAPAATRAAAPASGERQEAAPPDDAKSQRWVWIGLGVMCALLVPILYFVLTKSAPPAPGEPDVNAIGTPSASIAPTISPSTLPTAMPSSSSAPTAPPPAAPSTTKEKELPSRFGPMGKPTPKPPPLSPKTKPTSSNPLYEKPLF